MNNLDPEVAEDPDNLVVYGGTGRAARSWDTIMPIEGYVTEVASNGTTVVAVGTIGRGRVGASWVGVAD